MQAKGDITVFFGGIQLSKSRGPGWRPAGHSVGAVPCQQSSQKDNREGGQVLERGMGSFDEHDKLLVSREPALRRHRGEAAASPYRVMGLKSR